MPFGSTSANERLNPKRLAHKFINRKITVAAVPRADLIQSQGQTSRKPFPVSAPLEHVPKKVIDFFDQNMLHLFESERFLFDQMIPSIGTRLAVVCVFFRMIFPKLCPCLAAWPKTIQSIGCL